EVRAILPDGPDHVFEAIGLRETIEWAISLLSPGATATRVGRTPEWPKVSFDPLPFTSAGRSILGCTYGSCVPDRDFPRLAELVRRGQLPVGAGVGARIRLGGRNRR